MKSLLILVATLAILHVSFSRTLPNCRCNDDHDSEDCDCSEQCEQGELFNRCPHRHCHEDSCGVANKMHLLRTIGNSYNCDSDDKITKKCVETSIPECTCKLRYKRNFDGKCITEKQCDENEARANCGKLGPAFWDPCPKYFEPKCSDISSFNCTTPGLETADTIVDESLPSEAQIALHSAPLFKCPANYNCNFCLEAGCSCKVNYVRDGEGDDAKCISLSECKAKPKLTAPIEPPTTMPATCESGWEQFGKNCYKVFSQYGGVPSFDDSLKGCKSMGSDLASVHNAKENQFIKEFIKRQREGLQYFWVGLRVNRDSNRKIISAFWTDNSPMDYGNPVNIPPGTAPWADKEPNDFRGKSVCTVLGHSTAKWYNAWCKDVNDGFGAICKKSVQI